MKSKFFLLVVVALLAVGCARGEQPPWEEGKNLYITTTWQEISSSYIYYIVISADSVAPSTDPRSWNSFYVVKWEDHNFFLRKPGESTFSYFSSPSVSDQEMRVTLSLIDVLDDPAILRIMVVSTDRGGIEEDHLNEVATFRPRDESSKSWDDDDDTGSLLSLKIEVR